MSEQSDHPRLLTASFDWRVAGANLEQAAVVAAQAQ
jgi:hypothetical protein